MKGLLELIKLIFGPKALSKTIGTRTNVIRLPNNKTKRYTKQDLDIESASDAAAMNAKKEMEELIAEVPKMNDAERLVFEGNLRRLKNRLGIRSETDPTAEVFEFGTKEKVTPGGIASLTEQAGQKSPPGTLMGNIESRLNKLRASGEDLSKMKGQTLDEIMGDVMQSQKTMSKMQDEGLVRAAVRYKMMDDLKRGTLKLPKNLEDVVRGASNEEDVITVFRNNYGEDALEQVDSLIPDFYKMTSPADAVKKIEKNFPNIKPKKIEVKQTMSLDEATKAEEENILTPKKPEEPEEFATGGIVKRTGFKFGTKFGRFWKIARKVWDDINPTGDRKYDAQLVADELAEEIFKTSMDDLPQKVQIDLYALAYNNAPKVDTLFTNPQSLSEAAKKGMAASKEMESLGLDVSKNSDFFKYENMKLSGELGPEQQVQAYKDKIRDEFSGMIDDTLMKQVEVDDNPQRLAEVYASIKEGLEMQRKGMTPEEIIRVMKQTPRTKNAIGGRVGYMGGGVSKGLDYLTGIERRGYVDGGNVYYPNNPFYPSSFGGDTFQRYRSYLNLSESKDPLSSDILYLQPITYTSSSGDGGNDDDSQTSTTSGSGTSIGTAISNAIGSMTPGRAIGTAIGYGIAGPIGGYVGGKIGSSVGGGDSGTSGTTGTPSPGDTGGAGGDPSDPGSEAGGTGTDAAGNDTSPGATGGEGGESGDGSSGGGGGGAASSPGDTGGAGGADGAGGNDAGGGGSGGGGGKIVCTMMNESYGFGSFRNKIWLKHSKGLAPEYQKGYHKIFLPLVTYAKKEGISNKIIKKMLEHIAVHRTIDIRQESKNKTHLLGRIYRKILEPMCYLVGKYSQKRK